MEGRAKRFISTSSAFHQHHSERFISTTSAIEKHRQQRFISTTQVSSGRGMTPRERRAFGRRRKGLADGLVLTGRAGCEDEIRACNAARRAFWQKYTQEPLDNKVDNWRRALASGGPRGPKEP